MDRQLGVRALYVSICPRRSAVSVLDDQRLTEENVGEIICCPGGLELAGKGFQGDLSAVVAWRREMLKLGMEGFVSYHDGLARGFVEYMPAEAAPFPIEAPGAAVLMCYHWVPVVQEDELDHLAQEKRLVQRVIEEAAERFSGLATLGWDNPVHFPIPFLKELGFEDVERTDYVALMWRPFTAGVARPRLSPATFVPQDLFSQGLLAIESAWSSRCPYSLRHAALLEEALAGLPEEATARVRHLPHRVDTREEAVRWSIHPWNWEWAFANGEKIPIHRLKMNELREHILERLVQLCQEVGDG